MTEAEEKRLRGMEAAARLVCSVSEPRRAELANAISGLRLALAPVEPEALTEDDFDTIHAEVQSGAMTTAARYVVEKAAARLRFLEAKEKGNQR